MGSWFRVVIQVTNEHDIHSGERRILVRRVRQILQAFRKGWDEVVKVGRGNEKGRKGRRGAGRK